MKYVIINKITEYTMSAIWCTEDFERLLHVVVEFSIQI